MNAKPLSMGRKGRWNSEIKALRDEVARLQAKRMSLRHWLGFALDSWAEAAQYKGDFLREKHGDLEQIAKLRKALDDTAEDAPRSTSAKNTEGT